MALCYVSELSPLPALLLKNVDWDVKNQIKQELLIFAGIIDKFRCSCKQS